MLKTVVCIKQVPAVSELAWNPKTGTLRRGEADGMINPDCRLALEAALELKAEQGGTITVLTMGPPMAEAALYEALALGADRGVLLSDATLAGADTLATSYTLARAIAKVEPEFDLVLTGQASTDSETAQVGPQLTEFLDVPGAAAVESVTVSGGVATLRRVVDNFAETLEMDLPGLASIAPGHHHGRHVPLWGIEPAFGRQSVTLLSADDIGLDTARAGVNGSATEIIRVYQSHAERQGVVYKGAPKKIVQELFADFGDLIGGAVRKDLGQEG